MDIQNIIVAIIILFAAIYIGRIVWQKLKSFSVKSSSCGSDCGCDSKAAPKNSFVNIQKS